MAEATATLAAAYAEARRHSDLENVIFDEWLDKHGKQHSEYVKGQWITCGPEVEFEVITEAGYRHFGNYFQKRLEELNAK